MSIKSNCVCAVAMSPGIEGLFETRSGGRGPAGVSMLTLIGLAIAQIFIPSGWSAAVVWQEPAAEAPEQAPTEKQDEAQKQDEAKKGDAAPQDKQEKGAQDGGKDLEQAISLKETAASTRDLDRVVELCESAIEKGLDAASKKLAEAMITSTLNEHIKQLTTRIDAGDSRWRFLRREALSRLEKLLKYDPKNAEYFLTVARLSLMPGGDAERGREAVEKAIEYAGPDKKLLANALLLRSATTEDDKEKLADLNQAVIIDPTNQRARIVRGQYFIEHQKLDEAIADFREVLNGTEDLNPNIMFLLAQQLLRADRAKDALEFIDKAVSLRPEEALYLKLRADIHAALYQHADARKDRDEALKLIDGLLEANADNTQLLMLKAELQLDQSELEGALATVQKAMENNPGLVSGLVYRSLIHSRLDQHDQAIEDIKKVVEAFPSEPSYQLQLAAYYNAAKKSDEAVRIYDKLEKELDESGAGGNDSLLASVIRGRADAYSAMGKHREAIADYERAIKLQSEGTEGVDASTVNNLAWLLCTATAADVRDGKRAVELATEACEKTKFSESYALSTLAAAYAESGDYEKAKEFAAKAVDMGTQEKSSSLDNLKRELESYQNGKPWREEINKGISGPEGSESQKSESEKADSNPAKDEGKG